MSTRKGVFISVDEFIEQSVEHAKEELIRRDLDLTEKQIEEVSKIVGVGSIRFYINQISPEKPITFKWEEALSFERGCASIQYAHARACKLLAKSDYNEFEEVRCDYELDDEENIITIYRSNLSICTRKKSTSFSSIHIKSFKSI